MSDFVITGWDITSLRMGSLGWSKRRSSHNLGMKKIMQSALSMSSTRQFEMTSRLHCTLSIRRDKKEEWEEEGRPGGMREGKGLGVKNH